MSRFAKYLIITLVALSIAVNAAVPQEKADLYLRIKKNIGLFGAVYREVNDRYVDRIDPDAFIQAGIEGMLSTLDPYTVFLDNEATEDLNIMTAGQYGGVGIEIGVRGKDKALTVIAPIEGGPAQRLGIRPGDKIVEIEGESTRGFSTSDAATRLRGEPGTEVTITIERIGVEEPITYTLKRETITVRDITFADLLQDSIAYVKLVRFSRNAGSELRRTLVDLKKKGMRALVLDLRHNPGGLLPAAVEVTQNFIPKGEVIVSTKGRDPASQRLYRSLVDPVCRDIPMVVLVDEGSASASEITCGALQDLDRAVIVGKPTFGKGLVQTLVNFQNGRALKITTARYYTPSGRLIQKLDYFSENDEVVQPPDSLEDSLTVRKPYTTRSGRLVYGEGGITPDIEVDLPEMDPYETELVRGGYFYDFSAAYLADHPNAEAAGISAEMLADFRKYLEERGFSYQPEIVKELDDLRSIVETDSALNPAAREDLDRLTETVESSLPDYFQEHESFIRSALRKEIAGLSEGRRGSILAGLQDDTQLQKALDLLHDPVTYHRILAGPQQALNEEP